MRRIIEIALGGVLVLTLSGCSFLSSSPSPEEEETEPMRDARLLSLEYDTARKATRSTCVQIELSSRQEPDFAALGFPATNRKYLASIWPMVGTSLGFDLGVGRSTLAYPHGEFLDRNPWAEDYDGALNQAQMVDPRLSDLIDDIALFALNAEIIASPEADNWTDEQWESANEQVVESYESIRLGCADLINPR